MEAKRRSERPTEVELSDISEIRAVSEIARLAHEAETVRPEALQPEYEPAYSVVDPLEGDALSSSSRRRSERPSAYDAIAFVEGQRVLTITWLPPAV